MDVVLGALGLWVLLCVVVGFVAMGRGRSGFAWALLSMIITPLLAGLLLLLLRNLADGTRPNPWTHVRCPDCAEFVPMQARVCSHCGCRLVPMKK